MQNKKQISTFVKGIIVGVLSTLIATLIIVIFNITEAKIVNIDDVPQAPFIKDSKFHDDSGFTLHAIEKYSFKNYGLRSGFVDKIEVKPDGLDIHPEVEIIFIDKEPLRWLEEREIKCEYLIKISKAQYCELMDTLRDNSITKTQFRTYFYDNSGKQIYVGGINVYLGHIPKDLNNTENKGVSL